MNPMNTQLQHYQLSTPGKPYFTSVHHHHLYPLTSSSIILKLKSNYFKIFKQAFYLP